MQIKTNNKEERDSLLGALLALGYRWHGDDELATPIAIENRWNYERWPTVYVDEDDMSLGGNEKYATINYTWSEDAAVILKKLTPGPAKKSIRVNQVGDYHAKIDAEGIHIYNTTLSFDKFQEIVDAVEKFKK